MPIVPPNQIAQLLQPFLGDAPSSAHLYDRLAAYLDLILKWNARTNLTAVRDPAEIVRRHFGESLFLARHLAPQGTLLDFGSGAGFPGIPIQLFHPTLAVTLAESQGKKAAFLREAARVLALDCEIWSRRVEDMPPTRQFDIVALRAVDQMESALTQANARASGGVVILGPHPKAPHYAARLYNFPTCQVTPLPVSGTGPGGGAILHYSKA